MFISDVTLLKEAEEQALATKIKQALAVVSDPASSSFKGSKDIQIINKMFDLKRTLYAPLDQAVEQGLETGDTKLLSQVFYRLIPKIAEMSLRGKDLDPVKQSVVKENIEKRLKAAATKYLVLQYVPKRKQDVILKGARFGIKIFFKDILKYAKYTKRIKQAEEK